MDYGMGQQTAAAQLMFRSLSGGRLMTARPRRRKRKTSTRATRKRSRRVSSKSKRRGNRFVKGSAAARRHMAKLRRMRRR